MNRKSCRILLTTAAGLALTAGAVTLTGCSAVESALTHRETVEYKDLKDAAAKKSESFALNAPESLPADATSIKITIRTDGPGYLLGFHSATGLTEEVPSCASAPDSVPLAPAITADWWPETLPAAGRLQCGEGDMEIAHDGASWYAWTSDRSS